MVEEVVQPPRRDTEIDALLRRVTPKGHLARKYRSEAAAVEATLDRLRAMDDPRAAIAGFMSGSGHEIKPEDISTLRVLDLRPLGMPVPLTMAVDDRQFWNRILLNQFGDFAGPHAGAEEPGSAIEHPLGPFTVAEGGGLVGKLGYPEMSSGSIVYRTDRDPPFETLDRVILAPASTAENEALITLAGSYWMGVGGLSKIPCMFGSLADRTIMAGVLIKYFNPETGGDWDRVEEDVVDAWTSRVGPLMHDRVVGNRADRIRRTVSAARTLEGLGAPPGALFYVLNHSPDIRTLEQVAREVSDVADWIPNGAVLGVHAAAVLDSIQNRKPTSSKSTLQWMRDHRRGLALAGVGLAAAGAAAVFLAPPHYQPLTYDDLDGFGWNVYAHSDRVPADMPASMERSQVSLSEVTEKQMLAHFDGLFAESLLKTPAGEVGARIDGEFRREWRGMVGQVRGEGKTVTLRSRLNPNAFLSIRDDVGPDSELMPQCTHAMRILSENLPPEAAKRVFGGRFDKLAYQIPQRDGGIDMVLHMTSLRDNTSLTFFMDVKHGKIVAVVPEPKIGRTGGKEEDATSGGLDATAMVRGPQPDAGAKLLQRLDSIDGGQVTATALLASGYTADSLTRINANLNHAVEAVEEGTRRVLGAELRFPRILYSFHPAGSSYMAPTGEMGVNLLRETPQELLNPDSLLTIVLHEQGHHIHRAGEGVRDRRLGAGSPHAYLDGIDDLSGGGLSRNRRFLDLFGRCDKEGFDVLEGQYEMLGECAGYRLAEAMGKAGVYARNITAMYGREYDRYRGQASLTDEDVVDVATMAALCRGVGDERRAKRFDMLVDSKVSDEAGRGLYRDMSGLYLQTFQRLRIKPPAEDTPRSTVPPTPEAWKTMVAFEKQILREMTEA